MGPHFIHFALRSFHIHGLHFSCKSMQKIGTVIISNSSPVILMVVQTIAVSQVDHLVNCTQHPMFSMRLITARFVKLLYRATMTMAKASYLGRKGSGQLSIKSTNLLITTLSISVENPHFTCKVPIGSREY